MTITKTMNGTALTIAMEGWLDTTSSPELMEEIANLPADISALTLDFDKVEYISSAGLRAVAAGARKAKELNVSWAVVNAGTEVMSVFSLTGLDRKLNVTAK